VVAGVHERVRRYVDGFPLFVDVPIDVHDEVLDGAHLRGPNGAEQFRVDRGRGDVLAEVAAHGAEIVVQPVARVLRNGVERGLRRGEQPGFDPHLDESRRGDVHLGRDQPNAFQAREVIIVGRRRWNRRGAMVTDRYMHVRHLDTPAELAEYAQAEGYTLVAVDNLPGAVPLEATELPRAALLLFGQEGSGLSDEARAAAGWTVSIAQFGSTRSINAGVAAGIAMHTWIRQHAG